MPLGSAIHGDFVGAHRVVVGGNPYHVGGACGGSPQGATLTIGAVQVTLRRSPQGIVIAGYFEGSGTAGVFPNGEDRIYRGAGVTGADSSDSVARSGIRNPLINSIAGSTTVRKTGLRIVRKITLISTPAERNRRRGYRR